VEDRAGDVGLDPDPPRLRFDQTATDAQPHPQTGRLATRLAGEETLGLLRRDSRATVPDRDANRAPRSAAS